jgi:hypothetical protein
VGLADAVEDVDLRGLDLLGAAMISFIGRA